MQTNLSTLKNSLEELVESSLQSTFQLFLQKSITPINHQTIPLQDCYNSSRAISGIMAFLQENKFEGALSLGFSRDTAIHLFSTFYGCRIGGFDDGRLIEGVGELANVIHGIIKERLNRMGCEYQMCLPTIVVGNNHHWYGPADSEVLQMSFQSEFGEIYVDLVISQGEQKAKSAA